MGRLVEALNRRKQEMRVQVEEGLLRSEIWLEVGRPDAAARVLEEQRRLVDRFRGEVESVLAAAAVEYEAERILRGVAVDVPAPAPEEPRRRLVPAAVSAALSAVAAVAFVVMLAAPPEPAALEAAARAPLVGDLEWSAPNDDGGSPSAASAPLAAAGSERLGPAEDATARATSRDGADRSGVDLRGWLEDQRDLLTRLGVDAPSSNAVLRELEDLVTQLLPDRELVIDGLSAEDPAVTDPATDDPATEEPATDDPATDDPATEDPADDEPAAGETGDGAPPTRPSTDDPSPEPTEREPSLFADGEASPAPDDGETSDEAETADDGEPGETTADGSSGTSDRSTTPFPRAF